MRGRKTRLSSLRSAGHLVHSCHCVSRTEQTLMRAPGWLLPTGYRFLYPPQGYTRLDSCSEPGHHPPPTSDPGISPWVELSTEAWRTRLPPALPDSGGAPPWVWLPKQLPRGRTTAWHLQGFRESARSDRQRHFHPAVGLPNMPGLCTASLDTTRGTVTCCVFLFSGETPGVSPILPHLLFTPLPSCLPCFSHCGTVPLPHTHKHTHTRQPAGFSSGSTFRNLG